MRLPDWLGRPRYLLVVFSTATLLVAVALGWVGWRLLQLDRAVLTQQLQERLDSAADFVATTLLQQLSDADAELARLVALPSSRLAEAATREGEALAEDALLVVVGEDHADAYPSGRLLYSPVGLPPPAEPPGDPFAVGEAFEFEHHDYPEALTTFRRAADSGEGW